MCRAVLFIVLPFLTAWLLGSLHVLLRPLHLLLKLRIPYREFSRQYIASLHAVGMGVWCLCLALGLLPHNPAFDVVLAHPALLVVYAVQLATTLQVRTHVQMWQSSV